MSLFSPFFLTKIQIYHWSRWDIQILHITSCNSIVRRYIVWARGIIAHGIPALSWKDVQCFAHRWLGFWGLGLPFLQLQPSALQLERSRRCLKCTSMWRQMASPWDGWWWRWVAVTGVWQVGRLLASWNTQHFALKLARVTPVMHIAGGTHPMICRWKLSESLCHFTISKLKSEWTQDV